MSDLSVFPNTGHVYHFVPVPRELENELGETLRRVWKREVLNGWRVASGQPWVRLRADYSIVDGESRPGVWIAVETNLGPRTRGLVVEPHHRIPPEPVPDGDDCNQTPYAFVDESRIPADRTTNLRSLVVSDKENNIDVLCKIALPRIVWNRMAAEDPIDVDLVVDFGNTRTVAMLLEQDAGNTFNQLCRPLRFVPRATSHDFPAAPDIFADPFVVIDSWIVLNEAVFASLEPPSKLFSPVECYEVEEVTQKSGWLGKTTVVRQRVENHSLLPQMFIELSPAIMGGGGGTGAARAILRDARLEQSPNFFLSSPKRYLWDDSPQGTQGSQYWSVALNPWNPNSRREYFAGLPRLQGPVLGMMDTDGRYWDLDDDGPPNEREQYSKRPHFDDNPCYPRRDALTWAALAILEAAYKQINSEAYRSGRKPFVRRRLRSISVTVPSGWTADEILTYRQQWQKAINIFAVGHLANRNSIANGGERPELYTKLDEAVASQLPFIYNEIEALSGTGTWIGLVGRTGNAGPRVRVMNLDIGGGTSDVAVVEYLENASTTHTDLKARVLFKNSTTRAGDLLVKRIIEMVLLPQIVRQRALTREHSTIFEQAFSNPTSKINIDTAWPVKLARIVRLVFWPMVIGWLNEVKDGVYGNGKTTQGLAPEEFRDAAGQQTVDKAILDQLNECFATFLRVPDYELMPYLEPFNYDDKAVRRCIADVMQPMLAGVASVFQAFDCDMLVVSGKTSELPDLRRVVQASIPALPDRIIFANTYEPGDWYPFVGANRCVGDAKTATVVGAALARAIEIAGMSNWRLSIESDHLLVERNYWGIHGLNFDDNVVLKPGDKTGRFEATISSKIGRKRFLAHQVESEQVYQLRCRPGQEVTGNPTLICHVARKNDPEVGETLELERVEIQGADGSCTPTDKVELHLCTLADGDFWIDNPRFDIDL